MGLLLKNAMVYVGGRFRQTDLSVCGGVVSFPAGSAARPGTAVLDLSGKTIFPGLADVHVHFREPGFSYKETIRTGSLAAARGGFTDVCAMPNLTPAPDRAETLEQELALIRRDVVIRVHPYGTITLGRKGEKLADLAGMADKVVAFSDDGNGVQDLGLMREAMQECRRLGKVLADHCEVDALLRGSYIHEGEYARAHGHRGICSESEWRMIERDLGLAVETGCAYHVCHISTKESVGLIRWAKQSGVDVTCETGPHYLRFTDRDLIEDGRFKMNPPLRSPADREALLEGVADGTVDMLATDHAPHSAEEKSRGLQGSAMGVVGLETAFAAAYTALVRPGLIDLARLMELMHDAPCRRFGVGGELAEGAPADLTVFDLERDYIVDPAEFLSMGRATPFAGERVWGRCLMTLCGGEPVWKEETM
ncbi:MAG: dihydroorotase [Oscillospiraceae bacterium]|nr:dihydroorotase [Oscillospiraceae bacterium]